MPDRVEYEGDENELEVIEGMQHDSQTKTITQRRMNHHKTYFCFPSFHATTKKHPLLPIIHTFIHAIVP